MLVGMALYVRLLVYAGLSLFIISGLYIYMVVCVVYAYNLTLIQLSEIDYLKSHLLAQHSMNEGESATDLELYSV